MSPARWPLLPVGSYQPAKPICQAWNSLPSSVWFLTDKTNPKSWYVDRDKDLGVGRGVRPAGRGVGPVERGKGPIGRGERPMPMRRGV